MDPLIFEYISTDTATEVIFSKFSNQHPNNLLYVAINKVGEQLALPRKENFKYVFEDIKLNNLIYDSDLIALYYQLCAKLSVYYHQWDLGQTLHRRSVACMSKNTPPYLLFVSEATLQSGQSSIDYIEKHLIKYYDTSPRYQYAFEIYFQRMSCMGRLPNDKLLKLYKENKKFKPQFSRLKMANFSYYIETIKAESAKQLSQEIFDNSFSLGQGSGQYKEILPLYCDLYKVLFKPISINLNSKTNCNVLILSLLMQKKNNEALLLARESFALDVSLLLSCNYIRCELVNNNYEGAKRQIRAANLVEGDFFFHFFMSRAEFGKGNQLQAAKHFSIAENICIEEQLEELLNFELNLSFEMKLPDLRYILAKSSGPSKYINTNDSKSEKVKVNSEEILIGNSDEIISLREKINSYSQTNLPILITGETGVGKDVTAKIIHQKCPKKNEPFLSVNCGALTESLLMSELFGHTAGAFTGAVKNHKGLFESAGSGTLFLDEIGEISNALQVALLRVLDKNEFIPIGSSKVIKCNCRLIFATNADLVKLASEKKFRNDLLFRLKRLEIYIPPLRHRKEDIPSLVNYYLQVGRSDELEPKCSIEFINCLKNYDWPGNIRQLRNEIEKLRIQCSEKLEYSINDLPKEFINQQMSLHFSEHKLPNTEILPNTTSNNQVFIIKNPLRRLERMRTLFKTHQKFTRKELIILTKNSPTTVALDLQKLCDEGFIRRMNIDKTPRNDYFILIEN